MSTPVSAAEPLVADPARVGAPPATDAKVAVRPYSYFVAVVLGVVFTFNFLDRQLLSILAEPIRKDLGLTDTQLGALTGLAFAVFYSTFGIPIAWLADRTHRVRIVAVACAIWSLFSALSGLATNFVTLALARVGVGVGEAGGSPPSYSLIADYFPPERRGVGLAIYALGVPLGGFLGSALGAAIAANYGWRMAFFAAGAPGVLLALFTLLVVREPKRGGADTASAAAAEADRRTIVQSIVAYFRNPVLALTAASSTFSAFVSFGIINWAPAFLLREKGMSLSELAIYYSLAAGIAGVAGTVASGVLVDRLGQRDPRAYALVPMLAYLAAAPLFAAFVFTPAWTTALVFFGFTSLAANMWLTPALAVVQNASSPQQRSISSAIMILVFNLIGMGGGPLFVGAVSDWAKPMFGEASLGIGLAALLPFFVLAALAHYATARAIRASAATTA